jgi:hypothetical protein
VQRLLLVLSLVACRPSPASIATSNANAHARYTREVDAITRSLTDRFEPTLELLRERLDEAQRVRRDGLTFRVDEGRIGHVVVLSSGCSGGGIAPAYFYTRRGAGVAITVVETDLHVTTVHVKGSCGVAGCGTQPPPPVDQIRWLPVADLGAVTVETKRVRLDQTTTTCDHPIYPP